MTPTGTYPINPFNSVPLNKTDKLDPLAEFRRLKADKPQIMPESAVPPITPPPVPEPDASPQEPGPVSPASQPVRGTRPSAHRRIQPAELHAACCWFIANVDKVPTATFRLTPWKTVTDPMRWRLGVVDECQRVLEGRPIRAAGLWSDLCAFKKLVEAKP